MNRPLGALVSRIDRSLASGGATLVAVPCLVVIAVGEVLARNGPAALAIAFYAIAVVAALNVAATIIGPARALVVAVAVVAMARLMSASMPFVPVGALGQYGLVAIPIFLAVWLAARQSRYSWSDLGVVLDRRAAGASIMGLALGLGIGFVDYDIVRPFPLATSLRLLELVVPILVLGLTTGLVEELLFRGLLQRAAVRYLGTIPGALYGVVMYTTVAVARVDIPGVALVFLTAVTLAAVTIRTRSIFPAAALHTGLNVGLLLLAPFVASGGRVL